MAAFWESSCADIDTLLVEGLQGLLRDTGLFERNTFNAGFLNLACVRFILAQGELAQRKHSLNIATYTSKSFSQLYRISDGVVFKASDFDLMITNMIEKSTHSLLCQVILELYHRDAYIGILPDGVQSFGCCSDLQIQILISLMIVYSPSYLGGVFANIII